MSRIEFGDYLVINENDQYECGVCNESLGDVTSQWQDQTIQVEEDMDEMGVHWINSRDDFVFRRYICPNCKTQIDAEACLEDDDPIEWYSSLHE